MSTNPKIPDLITQVVRFAKDDGGSVTIEFTLLLPLFTAFLLLVTDASLLFLRQTTLMNVARDTARAVSRYAMTAAEAKTYAEMTAKTGQGAATATVTVANGAVTVLITTNAQSAAPFGIVSFAVGENLSGTATSTMEPI
jgi:Flp pilus assembly protein TadG